MPASILIVDDEKSTRDGLVSVLEENYDIYEARDAEEAFRLLDAEVFDIVLTDLRMAGKSGMNVIDYALQQGHQPACIMMTAYGDVPTAVEAMKRGAQDFLTKPLNIDQLEIILRRILKSRQTESENKELHSRLDRKYNFDGIIGNSAALDQVLEQIKQVSPSKSTVLLRGETGTGKELFAQILHQNSPRSRKPFITVHCAAISSNLLESELFGHEKGAFTGAAERRIGRFEAAHGGTLFLDEIGEIDASTQVKLLRFLENKTFERVGSIKPIEVDVRLVCATHRDLEKMVKNASFREDLYYRLSVIPINLPPLRNRRDDIPLLLNHFIRYFSSENNLSELEITHNAIQKLQAYAWPGNIRELRNFCENIVVMRQGGVLTEYDLDYRFSSEGQQSLSESTPPQAELSLSKIDNEKRLIRNALARTSGNKTKAADILGISRRTLHRKLDLWPELDYEK